MLLTNDAGEDFLRITVEQIADKIWKFGVGQQEKLAVLGLQHMKEGLKSQKSGFVTCGYPL